MIWLASYPRSGNTFFRIVLDEVYGIESSTFPMGQHKQKQPGYDYKNFKVVKTHLVPVQLEPKDRSIPAVYLVRDGRDALISWAHRQVDIVSPGSEFYPTLKSGILAKKGSHWGGGWSQHVNAWLPRADIVIRFEDLITNPIENFEKLRQIMDLPEPKIENLPTFKDLQSKRMKYGSGSSENPEEEQNAHRKKFFRKGKVGTWKEEMPEELHELFWVHHGTAMDQMGYQDGRLEIPAMRTFLSKTVNNLLPRRRLN